MDAISTSETATGMSAARVAGRPNTDGTPGPEQPHRLSLARLLAINAYWFGGGAHWQPITISLLPIGALLVAPNAADLVIGRANAAGNLFALLIPVAVGWLSDRTVSRWGRRRPWIAIGTAVNVVGLLMLGLAPTAAALVLAYLVVQIGFNLAGGAFNGVIPDVVPDAQRGRASGLLGMLNQLGIVVGLLLTILILGALGHNRIGMFAGYATIAVVLSVTMVITLVAAKEHHTVGSARIPLPSLGTATVVCILSSAAAIVLAFTLLLFDTGSLFLPLIASSVAAGVTAYVSGRRLTALKDFFSAFRSNDFFWTFTTRFFVQLGIYTILPWVGLYFHDVVRSKDFATAAAFWSLAVLGGAVPTSIIGGLLSDRLRRRKIFVYISSAVMALVASVLLFGLVESLPVLYLLGIVFGLGYGCYYAVDWALACDVLPDAEKAAGRDMALWHIAFTLPAVLGASLTVGPLHYLNQSGHVFLGIASGDNLGFRVVFATAAIWFVLGTIMVSRIRGVR
jgi:Na+/melibiose symporter-like transporter